jgi:hypothetical protein
MSSRPAEHPLDGGPALAVLPQFFFCWSSHGLFDAGYGVRAASPELLSRTPDDFQLYTAFCDYIPQAERQERADAPMTLARYRLGQAGYLIARKTLTGRTGTFFVHAIVDARGTVDPLTLAASADAPFWVTSEDELDPAQRALEPFAPELWAPYADDDERELGDDELERLLARFAGAFSHRRSVALDGEGAKALPQVRDLLRMLPRAVRSRLAFSTYEARERPGTLDVIGAAQAPETATVPDWVRRAVALSRSDPETLRALREDPRVTDLTGLVAGVEAIGGPLDAAILQAAVSRRSPYLELQVTRREFRAALLEAIDARPDWWRGAGLSHVLTLDPALGPAVELLEAAAERYAQGRTGAGAALVGLYQHAEPDLDQRLADLASLPRGAQSLGPLLLSDQREVADPAAWDPWLATRWDGLGEALRAVPPALHRRLLRCSIREGGLGAPSVGPGLDAHVLEVIAELARDKEYAARAASFLLAWVPNANALAAALRVDLPPAFVRGPLAERLTDVPELVNVAVRGELIRAGLADQPAFRRLIS